MFNVGYSHRVHHNLRYYPRTLYKRSGQVKATQVKSKHPMGTGISGKSKQPRESQSKQIPMGTGISGKFKKNMKSSRYIAHSGTFNPKRKIPNATSQWHSVDQQSSKKHTKCQRYLAHSGTFSEKPSTHAPAQAASTSNHRHKQHQQQSRPATPAAQTKQHKAATGPKREHAECKHDSKNATKT